MAQTYTSKATSINRDKLPVVYRKVSFRGRTVLDYGCGKYIEHIVKHLQGECCASYLPYDPYNQPDKVNRNTVQFLDEAIHYPRGAWNFRPVIDVVCSNVFNVIDDDNVIRDIVSRIEEVVTISNGTAFITVYEGDRSGVGRRTGKDQYQRNEPLKSYLRFFEECKAVSARTYKGMIVVRRCN